MPALSVYIGKPIDRIEGTRERSIIDDMEAVVFGELLTLGVELVTYHPDRAFTSKDGGKLTLGYVDAINCTAIHKSLLAIFIVPYGVHTIGTWIDLWRALEAPTVKLVLMITDDESLCKSLYMKSDKVRIVKLEDTDTIPSLLRSMGLIL